MAKVNNKVLSKIDNHEKNIAENKKKGQSFTPNGWIFMGIDYCNKGDIYYLYSNADYANGFKELALREEDLTHDNIACMIKYNCTRTYTPL